MKLNHIYNSVERLGDLLKVGARQAGAEHGLQPVHVEVLHYLSICNQYSDTPMAVTEYLGLTKGTVSQTLKVLEKKSLLVKTIDENDKRITHLKLSVSGQQLVAALLPTNLFIKACEQLSPEQQSDIDSSLKLLLSALLKANNLKTFGVCKTCRFNQQTNDGNYFCGLVKQPLSKGDVQLICREHE
ncbi:MULTISPECIES: MarR family winged helix-turn-helix transcriptional regulator [Pseudoalteromonas]|uniref:MarR family transcriptional regulator n=1 Tax=Pseudoalteromonas amylolytica TaxID=1859457 RepID=A0A1S1MPG4_9GAMM|nr:MULTISPECIES: MarR family winged helix-turn-helix transcriptional regulator [Pseudoalteromonas]OHU84397.1 MarR family transcriptional regulator [Pseudoalteromonas sp. JW3]OHU87063.1 MarR family transcriptional regulator [Pseudoalteromonas amylolytica]